MSKVYRCGQNGATQPKSRTTNLRRSNLVEKYKGAGQRGLDTVLKEAKEIAEIRQKYANLTPKEYQAMIDKQIEENEKEGKNKPLDSVTIDGKVYSWEEFCEKEAKEKQAREGKNKLSSNVFNSILNRFRRGK